MERVDGVITVQKDGTIASFNQSAEGIFGYQSSEVIGQNIETLFPTLQSHGPDALLAKHLLETQKGEILGIGKEIESTRKDGRRFDAYLAINETQLENQKLYTWIVRDLTTQKEMEAELIKYREHLEDLVEQRTQDLIHAKQASEEANKAKSEFLANMSHEIRTPMHGVLSFASLGLKNSDKGDIEKLKSYFKRILESGNRLLYLLNDLLDLSKLESGKMTYEIKQIDLTSLIQVVSCELEPSLANKNLTLTTQLASGSHQVDGDANRLTQVLRNLLSNAIKFSNESETIMIQSEPTVSKNNQDNFKISVINKGVQIPKNELDFIFNKFTQSTHTKTGAGGTGLGLAICKEIIAAHHGKIWAENGQDGSTILSFSIPVKQNKRSLLLIEDNDELRQTLSDGIKGWGYEVVEAKDGLEGFKKLQEHPFDIILADVMMPKMDGVEFTQKAKKTYPDLSIVLMSAYHLREIKKEHLFSCGANDFIAKPFERENLLRILNNLDT